MKKKNDFEFNYLAPTNEERKEIESIRNNYILQKQDNKLAQLRKLNNKVNRIPAAIALTLGIIGTLIFGLGLAMILEWSIYIGGVVVCFLSLTPIIIAYPIYIKIHTKLKNKYSQEIIQLSDDLLNQNKND